MEQVAKETHSHFEITFIGLLTESQPYMSFINIVKQFLNKVPNANVKICLAGNIEEKILNLFTEEFTSSRIDYKGYLSHEKAIGLMKKSQLLINVLAEMKESQILISGKLMEYIATGNPILCIGDSKGESAIIMEDIKNARVFEKEQIDKPVEFTSYIYEKWEKGEHFVNDVENETIKSKSRFETTRQLAEFINQV